MVTIPVKLYAATQNHDVSLHQVHEADGGRIHYHRVCEVCGKTIDYLDIARADGEDGQSVIVTDEDLASLPADRSREISVQEFVPAHQIDPLLFDRSYYLQPDKNGAKAYALLRRTLADTDRVAIVSLALRHRTRLGALRVHQDALAVQTLRWPDEVRDFTVPDQVRDATVSDREARMAATLVDSYAADFDASAFTDDYQRQLRELIDAKLDQGQTYTPPPAAGHDEDAEVVDLLAALERSVTTRGGKNSHKSGAKPKSKRQPNRTRKPAKRASS